MQVKIIFSDIDGTLLNNERQVSQHTIWQVKNIKNQIPFILVSARMPKQMYHIQEKLGLVGEPLIAYNGALVVHNGEIIHSVEMPLSLAEMLINYNKEHANNQLHISLYNGDEWFAPKYDFWAKREENNTQITPEILENEKAIEKWRSEAKGIHKITLMGEVEYIEPAYQYLNALFGSEIHAYRAKDTYIEIADINVSKFVGIKALLNNRYPFSLSEVMAFGDNYNDTEMLQNVGHGVAVANARDEVKKVAKALTVAHDEDGVANYLIHYFNL